MRYGGVALKCVRGVVLVLQLLVLCVEDAHKVGEEGGSRVDTRGPELAPPWIARSANRLANHRFDVRCFSSQVPPLPMRRTTCGSIEKTEYSAPLCSKSTQLRSEARLARFQATVAELVARAAAAASMPALSAGLASLRRNRSPAGGVAR